MRVTIPLIVGVLGLAAGVASLRLSAASESVRHKELSSDRAIAKAQPLLSALAKGEVTLNLVATPVMIQGMSGVVSKHWWVDASNASGSHIAYVVLDAESGELALASRTINSRSLDQQRDVSAASISAAALEWAKELCDETGVEKWEQYGLAERAGRHWVVSLRRSGRTASLLIAAGTAELISFKTRSIPGKGLY